jgi:hypothetical protein
MDHFTKLNQVSSRNRRWILKKEEKGKKKRKTMADFKILAESELCKHAKLFKML